MKHKKIKNAEILYFANGCWLVPKNENGCDHYSISDIRFNEKNHMEVQFTPAAHFVRINEESLIYDNELHKMLDALKEFAEENGFHVIEIAGAIDKRTLSELKAYGFKVSKVMSSDRLSYCELKLT